MRYNSKIKGVMSGREKFGQVVQIDKLKLIVKYQPRTKIQHYRSG